MPRTIIIFGLILLGLIQWCGGQEMTKENNVSMKVEIQKSEQEWKSELSPEEYKILREADTEPAGTGKLLHNKEDGVYECAACGNPLFSSETKYESGSGWPSYWEPINEDAVITRQDNKLLMRRTEVLCARCGSHLGHVFEDGPEPTGLRYCINSVALDFEGEEADTPQDTD